MLATNVASAQTSIGSMSGAMVVPDTPPPGKGPHAGRPSGRPTASHLLIHRPIGTAVRYAPNRFHASRSLSALFEKGHQLRQPEKTRTIQKWRRADSQSGRRRWIGPVRPFPGHGKRAVGSPLQNQRFDPPNSSEFEHREPLPLQRVKRMRDLDRSRKGTAIKCSY
jgi:hypothetical protein